MARRRFPEWRASHEPTQYPFQDDATLVNDDGIAVLPDTFLDAAFYPVGGDAGGYLSRVEVTATTVTLWYGDVEEPYRASGTFDISAPPAELRLVDDFGRPAGLLVSEVMRMAMFQAWDVGVYEFTEEQTGFVAACCVPTPEIGVRGIILDDDTLLTDDIYLVGDNGVVLSCDTMAVPATCSSEADLFRIIRVDVVGDPLWRRKECAPGFFDTPRFLQTITFQHGQESYVCGPGNYGDVKLGVGNRLAEDTILRIRPVDTGLVIETVGERLEDIR